MNNLKFKINPDMLGEYADFLKKTMTAINVNLTAIEKSNRTIQLTQEDAVVKKIDAHIRNLKKIYSNFNLEVKKTIKNLKEEQSLYNQYLSIGKGK